LSTHCSGLIKYNAFKRTVSAPGSSGRHLCLRRPGPAARSSITLGYRISTATPSLSPSNDRLTLDSAHNSAADWILRPSGCPTSLRQYLLPRTAKARRQSYTLHPFLSQPVVLTHPEREASEEDADNETLHSDESRGRDGLGRGWTR
jgi:hypothetical protein